MTEVEFKEGLTRNDLLEGKLFDGELIYERDDREDALVNMRTVYIADKFEIHISYYDVLFEKDKVKLINLNGFNEIFSNCDNDKELWSFYSEKLNQVGLKNGCQ